MMQTIDALVMVPGMVEPLIAVGPAFVGVMLALVAGVAWLGYGTAEEMRRTAARRWESARIHPPVEPAPRIAA